MTSRSERPSRVRLALGMAACAAIVWFVHLSVSYALVPVGCRGRSAVPLALVSAAGVVLGVCLAAIATRARVGGPHHGSSQGASWSDRLRAAFELGESGGTDDDTPRRIAGSGIALAAYFTFVMLLAALVPIVMDPCA